MWEMPHNGCKYTLFSYSHFCGINIIIDISPARTIDILNLEYLAKPKILPPFILNINLGGF
jgi:hypothetical protein